MKIKWVEMNLGPTNYFNNNNNCIPPRTFVVYKILVGCKVQVPDLSLHSHKKKTALK